MCDGNSVEGDQGNGGYESMSQGGVEGHEVIPSGLLCRWRRVTVSRMSVMQNRCRTCSFVTESRIPMAVAISDCNSASKVRNSMVQTNGE
jgi:hypothetical protein